MNNGLTDTHENLGVLTSLSRDTLVGNQARARDIFQQHSVADIHYHVNEEEALEDADDVSDMLTAMDLLTTPDVISSSPVMDATADLEPASPISRAGFGGFLR